MFWTLVFSYWIHLLATVIWFGSLVVMALAAWPALRKGSVATNQWLAHPAKAADAVGQRQPHLAAHHRLCANDQ
ncbi:MAG: hypothetical protein KC449_01605 [Anaerolineales bacterium]|nr:hypothetical protein [Anaerolineales bacterium]